MKNIAFYLMMVGLLFAGPAHADLEMVVGELLGVNEDEEEESYEGDEQEEPQDLRGVKNALVKRAVTSLIPTGVSAVAGEANKESRAARIDAELKSLLSTPNGEFLSKPIKASAGPAFQKNFKSLEQRKLFVDKHCSPGIAAPNKLKPVGSDCTEIYASLEEVKKDYEYMAADGEMTNAEHLLMKNKLSEFNAYLDSYTNEYGKWASADDPRLPKD